MKVARWWRSDDVLHYLRELFITCGVPDHLRSDNGSEFTARAMREWLECLGVRTPSIEPGSPWENGDNESFNGKLREELLDQEILSTLREAQLLIEQWRHTYNTIRPHRYLGHLTPAEVEAQWRTTHPLTGTEEEAGSKKADLSV